VNPVAREAVQYAACCATVGGEHFEYFPVSVAIVHDERFTQLLGEFDLSTKSAFLVITGGEVSVVVKSALAHRRHFRALGQCPEVAFDLGRPARGVVGVNSHGGTNAGFPSGQVDGDPG
jgi:hypothetical protein